MGRAERCRQEADQLEAERAKIFTPMANVGPVREDEPTGAGMDAEIRKMEVIMEKGPWGEWTHEEYLDGEFDVRPEARQRGQIGGGAALGEDQGVGVGVVGRMLAEHRKTAYNGEMVRCRQGSRRISMNQTPVSCDGLQGKEQRPGPRHIRSDAIISHEEVAIQDVERAGQRGGRREERAGEIHVRCCEESSPKWGGGRERVRVHRVAERGRRVRRQAELVRHF